MSKTSIPYEIAGIPFKSKSELLARLKYMLNNDIADYDFLLDFIRKCHPDAEIKIGCGVKRFFIKQNWQENGYGTLGFQIERMDGTTTDFSYIKALNHPSPWQEYCKACRLAVEEDILSFKMKSLLSGVNYCPYTGERLFKDCHVDHKAPKTFLRLLDKYIDECAVDWKSQKIKPTEDNNSRTEFINPEHSEQFRKWHNVNAELRLLSIIGNLSHAKKEAKCFTGQT